MAATTARSIVCRPIASCSALALTLVVSAACSVDRPRPPASAATPALVGVEPVAEVHLFENNSSSLIAWRRAGVHDRVLVHLDGHPNLDWIPDETVARLAAATATELLNHEIHPYSLRDDPHAGFGVANFVYPAARLGLVRELIWVVPDGALRDRGAAQRLILGALIREMQMVPVAEARSLRFDDGVVRGQILELPIIVCELSHLPRLDEPVLLDIDLDYFTTRSVLTGYVTGQPWTGPARVLDALRERGLRTDLATISLSTLGGFVPPTARWIGQTLRQRLRDPAREPEDGESERLRWPEFHGRRELEAALASRRELVERFPEDASGWFSLAELLEIAGELDEADSARARAAELDPLLIHGDLFVADRLRQNGGFEAALARYRRYATVMARGPFVAYALRGQARCLARLGRDEEAIAVYRRVLELAPGHADALLEMALIHRERGELDRAIALLLEARRAFPEQARYATALGTTYLIAGRLAEGVSELEQAATLQPCSWTTRGNLSAALLRLGRLEEAAGHLRVGLAFQPDNPRLQAIARQLGHQGISVAVADPDPHAPRANPLRRNVAHGAD